MTTKWDELRHVIGGAIARGDGMVCLRTVAAREMFAEVEQLTEENKRIRAANLDGVDWVNAARADIDLLGERLNQALERHRTTFSQLQQKERECEELRIRMANARYRIEQGRVWNGMGWTLTGLHAHQQQKALDELGQAMAKEAASNG